MLMPKKQKHRKHHKIKKIGKAGRSVDVNFGSFGLKALEPCWLSSRQIESARKVIAKYTKKGGKLWIRVFPDHAITKKGGEIPMGKGKGDVDHYVAIVKAGSIIFETEGISGEAAKEAMTLAAYKLPTKCKVVER
ncbi:MAG: 50S ribosomal protein L16 [Patescibacteria group bacterium]